MLSLRCRINANVAELLVIIVYTELGPRLYLPRHRLALSWLLALPRFSHGPIGVTIGSRIATRSSQILGQGTILVWLDGASSDTIPGSRREGTTIPRTSTFFDHDINLRQGIAFLLYGIVNLLDPSSTE